MTIKILCIFVLCLGAASAKSLFSGGLGDWLLGLADSTGILDPFGFQGRITDGLKEARAILKHGSSPLSLGPVDPISFESKEFDFSVEGTALTGSFNNVTIADFSNYDIQNVRFVYFPYPHLQVQLKWPSIYAEGIYNLSGTLLDHPLLKDYGYFTSETKDLVINLDLWAYMDRQYLQISDLSISYNVGFERINFTNGFNDEFHTLDPKISQEILKQVQERYFPSLMNYLKDLINHFLLRFTFEDLKNFALSLIQ